jgi:hypothetical protein
MKLRLEACRNEMETALRHSNDAKTVITSTNFEEVATLGVARRAWDNDTAISALRKSPTPIKKPKAKSPTPSKSTPQSSKLARSQSARNANKTKK